MPRTDSQLAATCLDWDGSEGLTRSRGIRGGVATIQSSHQGLYNNNRLTQWFTPRAPRLRVSPGRSRGRMSSCLGLIIGVLGLASPRSASAQGDSAAAKRLLPDGVTVGAFIDTYYAFDFGEPADGDRRFTTQPARHNEFNVNLVFIEAKLTRDKVRGRLALQAGTSVQSNYAAEPTNGSVSGPTISRHIQEAYAGVRVADGFWIDGGIFFSHIGLESWISRDNPTYTRSLTADYTPYYQTGVRAQWQVSPKVFAQLNVVNGWQIISENNRGKAAGVQVSWTARPNLTLGYANFFGDEQPEGAPDRRRIFNQISAKWVPTQGTDVWLTLDYGTQENPAGGNDDWYGGALIARRQFTPTVALSGRLEYYADEDQVVIATGLPTGFKAGAASIGVDVTPAPGLLWRSELRGIDGDDPIFPDNGAPAGATSSGFLVTSLALTL